MVVIGAGRRRWETAAAADEDEDDEEELEEDEALAVVAGVGLDDIGKVLDVGAFCFVAVVVVLVVVGALVDLADESPEVAFSDCLVLTRAFSNGTPKKSTSESAMALDFFFDEAMVSLWPFLDDDVDDDVDECWRILL